VRARLNVLSEIPDEWESQIQQWHEINQAHKAIANNQAIPDANDEYFLYQTLIGAFPLDRAEQNTFVERIQNYVLKAVREAKVHTAWLNANSDYEKGLQNFVEKLLAPVDDNPFLEVFRPFQQRIAFYGMLNSLAQTLLKITVPGVPDFYQGNELWDFSLVDPDNRRPVDYGHRHQLLEAIQQHSESPATLLEDLCTHWTDGRIKLFLIAQGLKTRAQFHEVFQFGTYEPLDVRGTHTERLVAFARRYDQQTAIALIPRFFTELVQPSQFPLGETVWSDTEVVLPQELSGQWLNIFTQETQPGGDTLQVGALLQHFPVALLLSLVE
jgi:(1->4)-alpha-D-glucan 1-alpha-D-glucosylmutase